MLSCVVAVAQNGVIGRDNQLPWHLPADLKHFKAMTLGKPIVMGRRTFDSIGRALPGRLNIVVTRQRGLQIDGCVVVDSLSAALDAAGAAPETALIGGAELFRLAWPLIDVIHLTRVHADVPGDAYFPDIAPEMWRESSVERHEPDEKHAYAYSFLTLTRR